MSKKAAIPDAWDDDWTNQADKVTTPAISTTNQPSRLSKAERRAQHVEQQKQLWDTAENPGRNLWLEAKGVVPLKQEFKAPVTLLSRKPQASSSSRGLSNGVANLALDADDDSEEEARKRREADFEERQRKAKIEREEKQRKYAEARERIMGSSKPASPAALSRESSQGRDGRKPRSRGVHSNKSSQPTSPRNQSPVKSSIAEPVLFDPNDMGRRLPKTAPNPALQSLQPSRQPRAPDNSGRGGFGFASRGGKTAV